MEVYVQFQDATQKVVIASFSCTQDATAYPNQGAIDSVDARYTTFLATLPKPM